jgi:rSAM/selenodomain-associated transferase 1
VIVVFAKAPHAGLVKTRMTPPLSPEQAAELYGNLLDDVLAATVEIARGLDLEPVVTVHPPECCPEISRRAPREYRVVAQHGRDLGERMAWAAGEAAAGGASPILLRGSDSPVLEADTVAAVVDRLEEADLAICPDLDGGYSLIGMRRPNPRLFDHAMSTQSVLEDTLANARELGLEALVLPPSFDLDTAQDLARLAEARERGDATLCPLTLEYLDSNQLWGSA